MNIDSDVEGNYIPFPYLIIKQTKIQRILTNLSYFTSSTMSQQQLASDTAIRELEDQALIEERNQHHRPSSSSSNYPIPSNVPTIQPSALSNPSSFTICARKSFARQELIHALRIIKRIVQCDIDEWSEIVKKHFICSQPIH